MGENIDSAIDSFYSVLGSSALPTTGSAVKKEKVVVKNYKRPSLRTIAKKTKNYSKCPRCGEMVLVDDLSEHMRIELLDPKYISQRIQMNRRDNSIVYDGCDIDQNLHEFASRRTDLFGKEGVELGIGEKAGEDKNLMKKIQREKESSAWDGHAETSSTATMNSILLEHQLSTLNAPPPAPLPPKKILMPPPPTAFSISPQPSISAPPSRPTPPPPNPLPPTSPPREPSPPPPSSPPPPAEKQRPEEPPTEDGQPSGIFKRALPSASNLLPSINIMTQRRPPPLIAAEDYYTQPKKKQKVEVQFIPEQEFLARFAESDRKLQLKVMIPIVLENKKYKLEGQNIELEMRMEDQVLKLKEHLEREIGTPPKKQNLKPMIEGKENMPILKDGSTFAAYNLSGTVTIQFKLKERGGKK